LDGGAAPPVCGPKGPRPGIVSAICKSREPENGSQIALVNPGTVVTVAHSRHPPDHEADSMNLGDLLTVEQILPEMKSTERWSAIVELVELLVPPGRIKAEDKETVLGALRAREETMSTGIGFGIAIPHASSDRVKNVVAAFGRSSHGIEFESLDNAPVRFIVLFVVPKDQFQTHLRTLAAIAKFLNDRSVREALAAAKTAEEILQIFKKP
jgi:mannitol/fructose-specific phosphotransferase system IIA component (Ntr-type)